MQAVERALICFFERVARKDRVQLQTLKRERRFRVEEERWCFTLPALHAFLRRHDDAFGAVDYRRFRRLIFASPINRAVKSLGAEIVVADNLAKVDRSRYALVWRSTLID